MDFYVLALSVNFCIFLFEKKDVKKVKKKYREKPVKNVSLRDFYHLIRVLAFSMPFQKKNTAIFVFSSKNFAFFRYP